MKSSKTSFLRNCISGWNVPFQGTTTYQNGAVSKKNDFHVDISKYPRGEFLFSTWGRKNSSEESNETSEEMNHAHVENKKYPRGDLRFPTWIFEKGG